MTKPLFDRVAILGVGLIGSSIAHGIRRGHLAREVVGHAHRAETLKRARKLGFADRLSDSAASAVKGADLVILATPVGVFGALAKAIAQHLKPGAIVSDVGSVKCAVIADVSPHIPRGVTRSRTPTEDL